MSMQQTAMAMIAAVALALPSMALADQSTQSMDMATTNGDNAETLTVNDMVVDIPAPKEAMGGFKYVTGGVGDVEQANMQAKYADYSFKLVNVLSGPDAAYVSNVHVTITHNGEVVLETTTHGPWLIADIPAGSYTVEASFDGATQRNIVKLHQGADQRLVMDWRA